MANGNQRQEDLYRILGQLESKIESLQKNLEDSNAEAFQRAGEIRNEITELKNAFEEHISKSDQRIRCLERWKHALGGVGIFIVFATPFIVFLLKGVVLF